MENNEQKEQERYVNLSISYKTRNRLKAFCATRGLIMKEIAELAIEQFLKQEKYNGITK